MTLNLENTVDIIEIMENWMERIRPPEQIRSKVDISYKIDDQSIIVFEIRPGFANPQQLMESSRVLFPIYSVFRKMRYVLSPSAMFPKQLQKKLHTSLKEYSMERFPMRKLFGKRYL